MPHHPTTSYDLGLPTQQLIRQHRPHPKGTRQRTTSNTLTTTIHLNTTELKRPQLISGFPTIRNTTRHSTQHSYLMPTPRQQLIRQPHSLDQHNFSRRTSFLRRQHRAARQPQRHHCRHNITNTQVVAVLRQRTHHPRLTHRTYNVTHQISRFILDNHRRWHQQQAASRRVSQLQLQQQIQPRGRQACL